MSTTGQQPNIFARISDTDTAVSSESANLSAYGDVSPSPEFLNRELTWLQFNRRVLHEAIDPRTPLLERVFFLGIFTSNLDEFFMKRVGGLKRQVLAGVVSRTADGMTPQQQLTAIRKTVLEDLESQAHCYLESIRPALREEGIHLLHWDELTSQEQQFTERYFHENLFPVLTPLAVDPGHPFPFMSNLSLSLGVALRAPEGEDKLFARIKVPETLPNWVRLDVGDAEGDLRFISLHDIIRHNLDDLFPHMVVETVMPFRITRNADIERDEEDAEDLLEMVEEELRRRRFAKVVRLETGPDPDPWILRFLMDALELNSDDVYEMAAELDYTDLGPIAKLNLPHLKYEPWQPRVPAALADEDVDIFSVIRRSDLMIHHPYESFTASVERFIHAAAEDPKVIAIKMTMYRTGDSRSLIRTLIDAAERGKQVVCLVELKARFDEHRNVQVAQALEQAGVHVVYGVVGLKTHTKTALVIRQEGEGLRCYTHVGTGNYNASTARLYTDLGVFTCDPEITADVVELFHYLTGRSRKRDYRKLLVAPVNMRDQFVEMIEREIRHQEAGRPGRIIAKMNSLEHRGICRALYRASQAGVSIDLVVRGFCCLRPGVPGMSENIRVISVVGRLLEHSRIYYFRNGAAPEHGGEFFIGSADWMYRNLHARVEAVTPVLDTHWKERCWEILQIMLNDHRQAWDMRADGTYVQRQPPEVDPNDVDSYDERALGTHQALMNLTRSRLGTAGMEEA